MVKKKNKEMRQFMVRIVRSTDEEYTDLVVDAQDEEQAKRIAQEIVEKNPSLYFSDPEMPTYRPDPMSDVEDVTGGEYKSVN